MCTRLLLAILLMPLTSHALDFQHRDTVVLADIIAVPDGRLGWTVGISQGGVFVGAPFLTKPDGPSHLRIRDPLAMAKLSSLMEKLPRLVTGPEIWLKSTFKTAPIGLCQR
jgi:hypothetical protein